MKKCLIIFSILLLSGLSFAKNINLRKEAKSGEIANIVFNEDDKYFMELYNGKVVRLSY